jgi:hypothetical protein
MRQNVTSATSKSNATASRRGVALVMFVILVFAFMAMAALSIDVGMASLTQAQMQNAVDSAAIEGIATRDFFEERGGANNFRRQRIVPERVRNLFDNDLRTATPDNGLYGAGPVFRVSGGVGDVNAFGLIDVPELAQYTAPERYVDDPRLQANLQNRAHGDMLSGTFIPSMPSSEVAFSYDRLDFTPASAATPFPVIESWRALGFLVRMRRTGVTSAPDSTLGISSAGPTVPLFFGLGTTVHAADGETHNVRRDGFTVRAAAIASGAPVLTVGPLPLSDDCNLVLARDWPIVNYWRPAYGVGPIAIEKSYWMNSVPIFDDDNPAHTRLEVNSTTGVIRGPTSSGSLVTAGRIYFGDTSDCHCPTRASSAITSVGDGLQVPYAASWFGRLTDWLELVRLTPTRFGVFGNNGRCYVPIYTRINGVDRVVGFGHATFAIHEDSTSTQLYLAIDKGFPDQDEGPTDIGGPCAAFIAPENASARPFSIGAGLSDAERQEIFDELLDLTYITGAASFDWRDVRNGALLAPVLVR